MSTSPRIVKVSYRAANGRLVRTFAKVPYSGLYALAETLIRAMSLGNIMWFRIAVATSAEITPGVRARLQRWPQALAATSERSLVSWAA